MTVSSTPPIVLAPEVREALGEGHGVVCVESSVVTHGLPSPHNAQSVWRAARAIRLAGAVSATIGVIDGKVKVGLSDDELARLCSGDARTAKLGVRDLAAAMAAGVTGGTTVSATAWIASRIGARTVLTGGLGGVHLGWNHTGDESSDLIVLSQAPVAVVCAGPKPILDVRATLERLEALAVPVMGLGGLSESPAFLYNDSGVSLELTVDDEAHAARVFRAHRALERKGGVLLVNGVPTEAALTRAEVEPVLEDALGKAREAGITGKALTPHLLAALRDGLGQRAVDANLAVLESNAGVAARLALHVAKEAPERGPGLEGA